VRANNRNPVLAGNHGNVPIIVKAKATAQAPSKDAVKCEAGVDGELGKFIKAKVTCVTKCLGVRRRKGGSYDGCLPNERGYDKETASCVGAADGKAAHGIENACTKECPACYATLPLRNCPDGAESRGEADAETDALLPEIYCLEDEGTTPTPPEAHCEDAVAKAVAAFVGSKGKCYGRCFRKALGGTVNVDECLPPASDEATAACVSKGVQKAVASIDEACFMTPGCYEETGLDRTSGGGWIDEAGALADQISTRLRLRPPSCTSVRRAPRAV
jgi:hypothetical protein